MSELEAAEFINRLKTAGRLWRQDALSGTHGFEYLADKNIFHVYSEHRGMSYLAPEQNHQYFTEQSFRRWVMVTYSLDEAMKYK